jgi:hypothetical protein
VQGLPALLHPQGGLLRRRGARSWMEGPKALRIILASAAASGSARALVPRLNSMGPIARDELCFAENEVLYVGRDVAWCPRHPSAYVSSSVTAVTAVPVLTRSVCVCMCAMSCVRVDCRRVRAAAAGRTRTHALALSTRRLRADAASLPTTGPDTPNSITNMSFSAYRRLRA